MSDTSEVCDEELRKYFEESFKRTFVGYPGTYDNGYHNPSETNTTSQSCKKCTSKNTTAKKRGRKIFKLISFLRGRKKKQEDKGLSSAKAKEADPDTFSLIVNTTTDPPVGPTIIGRSNFGDVEEYKKPNKSTSAIILHEEEWPDDEKIADLKQQSPVDEKMASASNSNNKGITPKREVKKGKFPKLR